MTKVPLWLRPLVWNELGLGGIVPQAVYFPVIQLRLTLGIEREQSLRYPRNVLWRQT